MMLLTECYLCGRIASRTLLVPVDDRYRCKSVDCCQRRIRARPGSYTYQGETDTTFYNGSPDD